MTVVVVGAGVVGLACAWALARRGVAVEVWTAGTLADGATGAAAGMLAPAIEGAAAGAHPDLAAALHASRDLWDRWHADLLAGCFDPPAFEGQGTWVFGDLVAGFKTIGEYHDNAGQLSAYVTSQANVRFDHDRRIDPRRMAQALAAAVHKHGWVIRQHCAVLSVKTQPQLRIESGDRVATPNAVIWAGGWRAHADIPALSALIPIRGQGLRLNISPPPVMLRAPGVYIAPDGQGTYVGASMQPGVTDTTPDAATTADLMARAVALWPALADATTITPVVGIRAGSPDHAPLLGAVGGGLYLATGAHRNGVLLAPYMAERIAEEIATGRATHPFAPGRFTPLPAPRGLQPADGADD
jgi:glycine oxidase